MCKFGVCLKGSKIGNIGKISFVCKVYVTLPRVRKKVITPKILITVQK